MENIEQKVLDYWTVRAHDFGVVRRNEIHDGISERWSAELDELLPGKCLRILDAGTGTGYFAVLLGAEGHEVTGIDLTPAMIDEARALAADLAFSASSCGVMPQWPYISPTGRCVPFFSLLRTLSL